tara:strand:- start:5853 stop:6662 length:810 start_codon:yes stop_codon:yes gene_type:complete
MKLSELKIRRIIKQEVARALLEQRGSDGPGVLRDYPMLERSDDGSGLEVFMTSWKHQGDLFNLLGEGSDYENFATGEFKDLLDELKSLAPGRIYIKILIDLEGGSSCPGYYVPNSQSLPIIIYEDSDWHSGMMSGEELEREFSGWDEYAIDDDVKRLVDYLKRSDKISEIFVTSQGTMSKGTHWEFFVVLNLSGVNVTSPPDSWPPDPCVVATRWRELREEEASEESDSPSVEPDSQEEVEDDYQDLDTSTSFSKPFCDQFPDHPTCRD